MKVELVSYTHDPYSAMASAGSNCYDSVASDSIVKHCHDSGHHSILEFADFHFKISGVSRALTHQLVRHRLASYAQRSQRYCEEDGFTYVTPPRIDALKNYSIDVTDMTGCFNDSTVLLNYDDFMILAEKMYRALKEDAPAEDARYVLPNACDTTIDIKINFRALMNFMNERLCTRAQWEIRRLARMMRNEVNKVSPSLAKMLVPKCEKHELHFCPESKKDTCKNYPRLTEFELKVNP